MQMNFVYGWTASLGSTGLIIRVVVFVLMIWQKECDVLNLCHWNYIMEWVRRRMQKIENFIDWVKSLWFYVLKARQKTHKYSWIQWQFLTPFFLKMKWGILKRWSLLSLRNLDFWNQLLERLHESVFFSIISCAVIL
jgi:hypothetical protein